MAKRKLIDVTTPLGYSVVLTRDRWREIVKFKHPSMSGRESDVRICLENPDIIRESAKDPDVHVYYLQRGRTYITVVAAPADGHRFVVTAYLSNRLKQGTNLWTK
jgi:hypothetical protein